MAKGGSYKDNLFNLMTNFRGDGLARFLLKIWRSIPRLALGPAGDDRCMIIDKES